MLETYLKVYSELSHQVSSSLLCLGICQVAINHADLAILTVNLWLPVVNHISHAVDLMNYKMKESH